MSDDDAAAVVRESLARTGLTPTDFGTVSDTITSGHGLSETAMSLPQVLLGESSEGPPATAGPDLVVIGELGLGGMGLVHLAEQRSLQREVAVKTPRLSDDSVWRALVREARIMGALEHPNLVPIHSLGVDAAGAPLLVMKRVEGTSWRELLRDDAHPAWTPLLLGHGDRMRANVDILVQVSRALAFAHDRGIVHRDLKPENVMIGRFGEVYLLDWGVAIRLSERESAPRTIVGTPGYLAPEMVRADPRLVDARTDVYLLGATLFEVLTGRAPHQGPTVVEALVAAAAGRPPPLSERAPAELVALVRASMALDPAARPPSAEAFREGLARYLASREVETMVQTARAALARAEAKLSSEGATSVDGHRALIEARFGLSSAARLRPLDEAIRAQLDLSGVRLVERELALRSPGAARLLLAELAGPPAELVRRVEALEAEVAGERAAADELSRSRRDADSTTMVRSMSTFLVSGLVAWVVWWLVFRPGEWAGGPLPPFQVWSLDLGIACAIGLTLLVGRKALFATGATRRVTLSLVLLLTGILMADALNSALGGDFNESVANWLIVGMAASAIIAVMELREMWAVVALQAACLGLILFRPLAAPVIASAHHVLGMAILVWALRRHAQRSRSR